MDDETPGADAPGEDVTSPGIPPEHDPVVPTDAPPTTGVALGQGKLAESDEKTMSMLAHILGGVTNVIGPLIIWLIKKDDSPFVDDQGKEATNFQITVLIGYVVATILGVITGGCASVILYPAVGIASLILAILGGVEANKGVAYRYPFALRLIS